MHQNNLTAYPLHARFSLITLLLFTVLLSGCVNLRDDPARRTPGVLIDDAVLEGLVEREIRKSDSGYKGAHIVVVAYNGVILLAGQVATADLKQNASAVAQTMRRVKRVHNELTVGGPISFFARSNDSWLTSKVKSRLIAAKDVKGTKIKVLTENGVVYLMGLVNRSQADLAVNAATQVYGVQKIVKVFEYLD